MTAPNPSPPADLSVEQVQQRLRQQLSPIGDTEHIDLRQARDRVLAQDVVSPISVPPHDNSAMDGYAFDGACLASGGPVALKVVGTALAGKAWTQALQLGECVKIMTGAIMPTGLDTVVPLELTTSGADTVQFDASQLKTGANRRRKGEDLMAGQPALRAGQRVTPAALGLLASLGLQTLTVYRPLRVAYFSTGDEILSLGQAPREGAVYDSNRYTLTGLLARMGVEVIDMGVVPDQPAAMHAAFDTATREADAIVTSGGVSMGDADHTRAIMAQMGDVNFWRVAMRPGRPMAFGQLRSAADKKAWLFGLPGNPVAAMVTFLIFVRPALQRLMGYEAPAPVLLQARCTEPIRKRPGRTEYPRGIVERDTQGQLSVRTTGPQGSGLLNSMVQANGLMVLNHEQGDIAVGDRVEVMLFDGVI
ncbi:molybdopterin molybdenumtransferase MoeA [Hydrogenophaga crassostreae]|uniref:Molybdopterin molybdenumtransferase n=1 Tax=Hydrogenophaga crassostreae TaxID=1763535 RepID=A0A167IH32_9BURK|nr:gephyrin-like molybdotransferase Glp [Hydrogenophaga crassostreae]AOW13116.1 molybdopterin molybdenumtransferase MoeA [Hydrogenophaga crassostreae]OAD42739.1 molybdopterin molybdenumtransferase MoeA [Hydrogenophaga crassostreae]